MPEQRLPTAAVAVAPRLAVGPEPFPVAVLDLDARRGGAGRHEPDLDLRGIGSIAPEVPQVAETIRWLPDRDLAPVVLDTTRSSFEDPTAGTRLQDDKEGHQRP